MSEQVINHEARPVEFIALGKLQESKANVRRTDKRIDVDSLAADIAAHGVLNNLIVTDCGNGRYAVCAGGRRLTALRLLAKQGRIVKDFAAPCRIVTDEEATEISLAENVQRASLGAIDEAEAYASLVDDGMNVEDIARRFGVNVRHVEQRLALARLSPKIRTAYRKGEINLDAARAFCITDDQAEQERLFKQLSKPITHAQSVRQALTQDRVPADHRLARFVGIDAYRAAKGRITSDLYEDGVVFLDDGKLVQRLAGEKAETIREALIEEGWGWAEVQFGHAYAEGMAAERLSPRQRRFTAKEKKELARLEAEIERLDTALAEAEDDDPAWTERDEAEAALAALREAAKTWDAKEMGHAGALIAIAANGAAIITRGLIKRADLKALRKLRAADESAESDSDEAGEAPEETGPRLPKTLIEDLSLARTRALRAAIARSPHVALALLVSALAQRSFRIGSAPGVGMENKPVSFDEGDEFERGDVPAGDEDDADPATHLTLCLERPVESLLDALAVLVAETIDFRHRGAGPGDARLQAMSDAVAAAIDLDMAQHWSADESFWAKAPKSYTLAALDAAPSITMLTAKKRAKLRAEFVKMKRPALAAEAAKRLQDAGWLPELLITPARSGAFAVTPDGEAAASTIAAE